MNTYKLTEDTLVNFTRSLLKKTDSMYVKLLSYEDFINNVNQQFKQLKDRADNTDDDINEIKEKIEGIKDTTNTLANEIKSLHSEDVDINERIDNLEKLITELQKKVNSVFRLTKVGNVSKLSTGASRITSTTVGDYCLFGVGTRVETYNSALVLGTTSLPFTSTRYECASGTVGNTAIFAGGFGPDIATVEAFSSSLVRSSLTSLSAARGVFDSVLVGNRLLFGGGYNTVSSVDVYDSSLSKSNATGLSVGRGRLAACNAGVYGVFGGGITSGPTSYTDAYDTDLTKVNISPLNTSRYYLGAARVDRFGIFAFGNIGGGVTSSGEVYDSTLTHGSNIYFSKARAGSGNSSCECFGVTSTNGFLAVFGGGYNSGYIDNVDYVNKNLQTAAATPLSHIAAQIAGGAISKYILFAGGTTITNADAYEVVGVSED